MKKEFTDGGVNIGSVYETKLFFDISPDILCISGFDGYFKQVNTSFLKLLGYSKEEIYSSPIQMFMFHEDREKFINCGNTLANGNSLMNFENRYQSKSGEVIWLSWTSVPDMEQNVIYSIAKNITSKKKLEEDRNTLLACLTKANKELKDLTITTSHDLRAPVNNLLALFEILDMSSLNDPDTIELFRLLKVAANGMKETLDAYVDVLAKKELLQVNAELLDFEEVFQKVKSSLNSLLTFSKAEVSTDFSQLPYIRFNNMYLESIFLNLLTNAVKYAKPDSIPRIEIRSAIEKGICKLYFSDEGLGFDMERFGDKIFGFQQTFHNNADSKGIGLYLIHSHITAMGGKISVESEPGRGATFIISFSPIQDLPR
jgi:PAS domain S-box-containing protein